MIFLLPFSHLAGHFGKLGGLDVELGLEGLASCSFLFELELYPLGVLELEVDLGSKSVDLFGHDGSHLLQPCDLSFVLDCFELLSAEPGPELAAFGLNVLLACVELGFVLFEFQL